MTAFDFVMAGLVPAIHVLQNINMAGGWVYILTNRPNGILYVGVTSDLVVCLGAGSITQWAHALPGELKALG